MRFSASNINPTAVLSLVLAVLGLPLMGVGIGAVAMTLAGVALGQMSVDRRMRGKTIAYLGLIIGLVDMLMWSGALGFLHTPKHEAASGKRFEEIVTRPLNDFKTAPTPIKQALEANVFFIVEQKRPLFFGSDKFIGSGVILAKGEGGSLILTNRHVIEPSFTAADIWSLLSSRNITAYFCDGTSKPGAVWWVGPLETDLAVVVTGIPPEAPSLPEPKGADVRIGDKVFAVGNPHELNWSYTEGVVSGIRKMGGPTKLRLLQTQTPINPGNSGGGLYAQDGDLIGIVTWTKDKSQAEGISFAIAYDDFLNLYSR
jgi:S1-C subfamily serine protease